MKKRVLSVFLALTLVLAFNMLAGCSASSTPSGKYISVNQPCAVDFRDSNMVMWYQRSMAFPGKYEKINNEYRLEITERSVPEGPMNFVVLIAEMDGNDLIITNSSKNGFHIEDMNRERFVKQ